MSTWITTLAGLYLLRWAIGAIRHMSRHTCHRYRLGVVLLGASALCYALLPLYQVIPTWLAAAALLGVSLVLWSSGRPRF